MHSVTYLNMEIIGSILRILFTKKGYCTSPTSLMGTPSTSFAVSTADTLYSLSNGGHGTLFYLVLTIYGRAPEPFEYLRCSLTTTEEEIKIFIKRVLKHPGIYIILHVNYLSHFLQEVFVQHYLHEIWTSLLY